MRKTTNTNSSLKLQACLRQNIYLFGIILTIFDFNQAINVFTFIKIFDLDITAIIYTSKIKSKIYKYNYHLFAANH